MARISNLRSATCAGCGGKFTFPKRRGAWRTRCDLCPLDQRKVWRESAQTVRVRFNLVRFRSRRAGQETDLTFEEYADLLSLPCHYCKFALDKSGVGLDRKDNNRTYLRGNVLPCCGICNMARRDHFSIEEMEQEIGPAIRRIKLKREKPDGR